MAIIIISDFLVISSIFLVLVSNTSCFIFLLFNIIDSGLPTNMLFPMMVIFLLFRFILYSSNRSNIANGVHGIR